MKTLSTNELNQISGGYVDATYWPDANQYTVRLTEPTDIYHFHGLTFVMNGCFYEHNHKRVQPLDFHHGYRVVEQHIHDGTETLFTLVPYWG